MVNCTLSSKFARTGSQTSGGTHERPLDALGSIWKLQRTRGPCSRLWRQQPSTLEAMPMPILKRKLTDDGQAEYIDGGDAIDEYRRLKAFRDNRNRTR